jgi:hypothetical protein
MISSKKINIKLSESEVDEEEIEGILGKVVSGRLV